MTRDIPAAHRQITALERIADALERLNDREEAIIAMSAKKPQDAAWVTTPAPLVPKQQERKEPTDAEFPDDEVEGLGPDDE